nr:DUF1801 domain-containing protein [Kineococcus vitellinus]
MQHPLKDGVLRLRAALLGCEADLSEHVKWNAPSFRHRGEDRITFRLHPYEQLQLVFHRGAQVRADTAGFAVEDPGGLLRWLAPDRAVVDFPTLESVAAHEEEVVALARRWVLA